MSNTQLALLLQKYELQLDTAIAIARSELAAISANLKDDGGLIDSSKQGFREPEDSPDIPALHHLEGLSNQVHQDIKTLLAE